MSVAVETIRNEMRFMVRRMALPIQPHEISVKAQHNKVARITGIPARRIKDFWYGAVNAIPAHQDRTIRAAYVRWLENWKAKAFQDLQQIESEHAELVRAAADHSAAYRQRTVTPGHGPGEMGGP